MNDSSSKLIAALFAEQRVLTVTEVTEQIKDTLESNFRSARARGGLELQAASIGPLVFHAQGFALATSRGLLQAMEPDDALRA